MLRQNRNYVLEALQHKRRSLLVAVDAVRDLRADGFIIQLLHRNREDLDSSDLILKHESELSVAVLVVHSEAAPVFPRFLLTIGKNTSQSWYEFVQAYV